MDCAWLWPPALLCSVDDSLLLFRRRRDRLTGSTCRSSASLLSPITWEQGGRSSWAQMHHYEVQYLYLMLWCFILLLCYILEGNKVKKKKYNILNRNQNIQMYFLFLPTTLIIDLMAQLNKITLKVTHQYQLWVKLYIIYYYLPKYILSTFLLQSIVLAALEASHLPVFTCLFLMYLDIMNLDYRLLESMGLKNQL